MVMLKFDPKDRVTIEDVLKSNIIWNKVKSLIEDGFLDEEIT